MKRLAIKTRSAAGAITSAAAGVLLAAYGIWALAAIPRGPHEFSYQDMANGNAFWPLPFGPLNGFTPEQLSSHVARAVFLVPACLLFAFAFRNVVTRRRFAIPPALIILLGVVSTAAIAAFVIRGVPLQDDDATYVMQAQLLTRGLVADPTHPAAATFDEPFTIFTHAGMSGMYPFGTPLVLAAGMLLGTPWLGQGVLVALTLWCSFHAAARSGDRTIASLGSVLLAVSPMFTFTSAGSVSQVPALAGVALAVLGWSVGGWRGGVIAGSGLGIAFVARPQVSVPAGLALLVWSRFRDRRLLAAILLAGLPWLLATAIYNDAVMGTPWQQPRSGYTGSLERYGFGKVLGDYSHTPLKAAALVGTVLVRLNGWSLGWPMSLAGPVLWLLLGRPHRAVIGPWLAVAVATFLFQAGYPSVGTSETGTPYHYAALPFIAFATASALEIAATRPRTPWIRSFALASIVLGTTSFYVEHGLRLSRLATAIEGPRRALHLDLPALLYEDAWQSRPQVGWVFGIPFRDRSPSSPVVRYPRPPTPAQLALLTARWKDRNCQYLSYDWTAAQYRVDPCSEIRNRDRLQNMARLGGIEIEPGRRADGSPWFENGGWKEAFPYLYRIPRLHW